MGCRIPGGLRGTPLRRVGPVGAALALAAALQLVAVASLALQPLDVRSHGPAARSPLLPLFNDAVYRIGPGADFFAVYRAGVHARAGRSPYGREALPGDPPYGFAYRYLPVTAQTLGRALSLLPARAAYLLWVLLLQGALWGFLWLWLRRVPEPRTRRLGALALLLSSPFLLEVHMGQFTFIAAVWTCAALLLFEDERRPAQWLAGALLACSMALKGFALATLPALRRQPLARATAAAAFALLLVLGAIHFAGAPADWAGFRAVNFPPLEPGRPRGNFGMLHTLTVASLEAGVVWSSPGYALAARAWQILLLGAAALLAWRAPARLRSTAGATLMAAFFLSTRDVWEHHYSGALLFGLLILRGAANAERGQPRAVELLGWLAVACLAAPTPFALFDNGDLTWASWPGYRQWLLPLTKSGPLLLLTVLGLYQLATARRDPS